MKVAILGTRGIPASYCGFETAAEQLASRLTARGHEVVVYCRPHVVDRRLKEWKGARLVHLPTLRNKYLDTFTHTFLSRAARARRLQPDVALFFIAGNSPLCLITRGAGIPTVINVDGLDSRPLEVAARSPRPTCASPSATRRAGPTRRITDSHAVADDLRAALRPPHRRRALRRRGPRATTARETLERLGLEPRKLHPLRRAPGAREQPAPARRGVRAHPGRARARA